MANSLSYSNARAKILENTLISAERLNRMIMAENIDDAVKVLVESNYGNGVVISNPNNYDLLLRAENEKIISFLKEVMPEGSGLEAFLFEEDAKNLKACMKLKYGSNESKENLFSGTGNYDVDNMYDNIMNDNYLSFPKPIKDALIAIDYEFTTQDRRVSFIDIAIDKAVFETIFELLNRNVDKQLKYYYKCYVSFLNFSTFMRCRMNNLDFKVFKDQYIENKEDSIIFYERNYEQSLETLIDIFKYKDGGKVFTNAINEIKEHGTLIAFEKERDDFLLNIFKKERNNIFNIAPMTSFYLMKKIELRMVKLILVCVKNNVERSEIKKRLRNSFV